MSSNFWQTKRQTEQFGYGQTITQKVKEYETTWMERCYSNGIPDEVSDTLMNSGRVPSYRAIALCLLKNDLHLRGIGFGRNESKIVSFSIEEKAKKLSKQFELF